MGDTWLYKQFLIDRSRRKQLLLQRKHSFSSALAHVEEGSMQTEVIKILLPIALGAFGIVSAVTFLLWFRWWAARNRKKLTSRFRLNFGFLQQETSEEREVLDQERSREYLNALKLLLVNTRGEPSFKLTLNFDYANELIEQCRVIHLAPDPSLLDLIRNPGCHRLLIVGSEGSGKTTTVEGLAREFASLPEAKQVPVILQANRWNAGNRTLETLIIDQLRDSYNVPNSVTIELIRNERLAIFLDGLDEIEPGRQADFVHALNQFFETHGLTTFVLTSQEPALVATEKLRVNHAIRLLPLTQEQTFAYAAETNNLELVTQLVLADPDLALLARNPLFLTLICETFPSRLFELAGLTKDEKIQILADAYVQKKMGELGLEKLLATKSLQWLARTLKEQKSVELVVDQLQPTLLKSYLDRTIYSAAIVIIVCVCLSPWLFFVQFLMTRFLIPYPADLFPTACLTIGATVACLCYKITPYGKLCINYSSLKSLFEIRLYSGILQWFILSILTAIMAFGGAGAFLSEVHSSITTDSIVIPVAVVLSAVLVRRLNQTLMDHSHTVSRLILAVLIGVGVLVPLILMMFALLELSPMETILSLSLLGLFSSVYSWVDGKLFYTDSGCKSRLTRIVPLTACLGLYAFGAFCLSLCDEFGITLNFVSEVLTALVTGNISRLNDLLVPFSASIKPVLGHLRSAFEFLFSVGSGAASCWALSYFVQNQRQPCEYQNNLPNESIVSSAKNSIACAAIGLVGTFILGVLFCLPMLLIEKLFPGLLPIPSFPKEQLPLRLLCSAFQGATIGFIVAALPVAQHYTLRFLLWRSQCVPFRLVDFLTRCERARILVRTGASYRFVHAAIADAFTRYQGAPSISPEALTSEDTTFIQSTPKELPVEEDAQRDSLRVSLKKLNDAVYASHDTSSDKLI